MKRIKYALLAAALTAASVVVPAAGKAEAAGATWKKDAKGWWVSYGGSSYAKSEWVGGYWLRATGYWDGTSKRATWKKDTKGWWFGYNKGWYAKAQWQLIDGKWYYFDKEGYMAADCFVDGYYLGKNGAWDGNSAFKWVRGKSNVDWWYGTPGGAQYLKDGWYTIDGYRYHFDSEGWLCTWGVEKIGDKIYSFDKNGHEAQFTAAWAGKEVEGSAEFVLRDDNREKAAKDLNAFLVLATAPGTRKYMTFNGVTKRVEHESDGSTDFITIDGEKLVDFVLRTKVTNVTVSGKGTVSTLLEKLTLADVTNSLYAQKVTIGGVAFTEFRIKDNVVSFKADGEYTRCLLQDKSGVTLGELGFFYTDVTNKKFFKTLKSVGVLGDSIVYTSVFPK